MVLNAFIEGLIALLMGAGLVVVANVYSIADLKTPGTMLMGAGVGYILRELGAAKQP